MRASLAPVPTYSQGLVAVNDNRAGEANQILMLLGRLEGTVSAIQQDIAEIREAAKEDREAVKEDRASAGESRRRLHEKIEGLSSRVQKTESTVRVLGELVDKQGRDVKSLSPKVDAMDATMKRWTLKGGAVVTAIAAVGGALWYVAAQNWVAIWRFFDQFIPKG